ncbi:MAG: hypothetical protein KAQ87_02805 [Candidatus Pacebacteria bacterium]|nr:hypothetical protein [Candidatus Paceibacterota bacterium]
MASEKTNKKFMLLAIILGALFIVSLCLIYHFSKGPEIETKEPVIKEEEEEIDIIKRLTVPVDPNIKVEPISEEVLKRLTIPVDSNVKVEPLSEEMIKNLTAPK